MKETKDLPQNVDSQTTVNSNVNDSSIQSINDVLDEFNNRFEILAQEIDNIKDIVLKLQCYTMDVNKMLVDERVHVFSELGNNSSSLPEEKSKEVIVGENIRAEIIDSDVDVSLQTSVDLRDLVKEEFSVSNS